MITAQEANKKTKYTIEVIENVVLESGILEHLEQKINLAAETGQFSVEFNYKELFGEPSFQTNIIYNCIIKELKKAGYDIDYSGDYTDHIIWSD